MGELRLLTNIDGQLRFDKLIDPKSGEGLIVATVVDVPRLAIDGLAAIRMQGYMNRAAIDRTITDGFITFFSRTTGRLWQKGETSGNYLRIRSEYANAIYTGSGIYVDCDGDSLLIDAEPVGPTCHTGSQSCFEV
jgi:phosphoribosyl-ATP pyrophosphohydrolase/phosphoribosyl-AMP cyclohydrolase